MKVDNLPRHVCALGSLVVRRETELALDRAEAALCHVDASSGILLDRFKRLCRVPAWFEAVKYRDVVESPVITSILKDRLDPSAMTWCDHDRVTIRWDVGELSTMLLGHVR